MRILAIETATATCSVALFEDGTCLAHDTSAAGRGAAERLMPMIAALPDGGRAGRIRVDCGPGSFTGIRVGISAARALGFGWGVPVEGYSSLELIAATWFAKNDAPAVTVVIEGGHGEVFAQSWQARPLAPLALFRSCPISDFNRGPLPLTGNAAHRFGAGDDLEPEARNLLLLDAAPLPVQPLYGRGADAKPMA